MPTKTRQALANMTALVKQAESEVIRRCRMLENPDPGMSGALASLSAAVAAEESVREALKDAQQNGHKPKPKARKRRAKARKKPGPQAKRPAGPTVPAAMDEAIEAWPTAQQMTVKKLFETCQAKYPGRFPEYMLPGFTSTFSKRREKRGDVVKTKENVGSEPAVYMKVAGVQPP